MASKPYIDKRHGIWYCKIKEEGRWVQKRLGKHPAPYPPSKPPKTPPREIQDRRDELERIEWAEKAGLDGAKKTGLARFTEEYQAAFDATHRPTSIAHLRQYIRGFVAFCKKKNVLTVEDVTKKTCIEYMEDRASQGISMSTIRTERGYLAAIFAAAEDKAVVPANPWHRSRLPGPAIARIPVFWNREEVAKLIQSSKLQWHKDIIAITANTGLRIRAALSMRWDWIDWTAGFIRVPPKNDKAKSGYTVPMNDMARDTLTRINAAPGSDIALVFPGRNPGEPREYSTIRAAFSKTLKRAGVRVGTLHDLRHTFGRSFALSGAPINTVQGALGHHSLAMTQKYTSVSGETAAPFMEGFSVGADPDANAADSPAPAPAQASSPGPWGIPQPPAPPTPPRKPKRTPAKKAEGPPHLTRAAQDLLLRAEKALARARKREAEAIARLQADREKRRQAKAAQAERERLKRVANEAAKNQPRKHSFDLDAVRARLDAQAGTGRKEGNR